MYIGDAIDLKIENDKLKAENEELRQINKANADNYVKWRDELKAENIENGKTMIRLANENDELRKQIDKQANAKIQLKNLDSRFAQDYCIVKHKLKKIKKYVEQMLKCTSGHTKTYYDILTIIEEKE